MSSGSLSPLSFEEFGNEMLDDTGEQGQQTQQEVDDFLSWLLVHADTIDPAASNEKLSPLRHRQRPTPPPAAMDMNTFPSDFPMNMGLPTGSIDIQQQLQHQQPQLQPQLPPVTNIGYSTAQPSPPPQAAAPVLQQPPQVRNVRLKTEQAPTVGVMGNHLMNSSSSGNLGGSNLSLTPTGVSTGVMGNRMISSSSAGNLGGANVPLTPNGGSTGQMVYAPSTLPAGLQSQQQQQQQVPVSMPMNGQVGVPPAGAGVPVGGMNPLMMAAAMQGAGGFPGSGWPGGLMWPMMGMPMFPPMTSQMQAVLAKMPPYMPNAGASSVGAAPVDSLRNRNDRIIAATTHIGTGSEGGSPPSPSRGGGGMSRSASSGKLGGTGTPGGGRSGAGAKRKRMRAEELEEAVKAMTEENERLKLHITGIHDRAKAIERRKLEMEGTIAAALAAGGTHGQGGGSSSTSSSSAAVDDTALTAVLGQFRELYADYGEQRKRQMQFHLKELEGLLLPTQTTKMSLWTLDQDEAFYSDRRKGTLSHILTSELGVTQAQITKIQERRERIKRLISELKESLRLVKQLERTILSRHNNIQKRMTEFQDYLTPRQAATLILWVTRHSTALETILNDAELERRKAAGLEAPVVGTIPPSTAGEPSAMDVTQPAKSEATAAPIPPAQQGPTVPQPPPTPPLYSQNSTPSEHNMQYDSAFTQRQQPVNRGDSSAGMPAVQVTSLPGVHFQSAPVVGGSSMQPPAVPWQCMS